MDINWWAFVTVVLVAYAIPGPDFVVIMRALTRGRRPGIAAALGAQAGLCVHVALAVVGLSVVLARHPEVLTTVRVAGGLYLLYLGGRLVLPTLRRRSTLTRRPSNDAHDASATVPWSAFRAGLLTNLLNPKALLFFAAVLPQFLDAGGAAPLWAQVTILGVADVALGIVAWTAVIAIGLQLARVLETDRVRRWWDRATGITLGALGGGLVVSRN